MLIFRILSINARGIANDKKRRTIFDFHRNNADILIIQETHSTAECERIWRNEWGGKIIFSHGSGSARGIAMLMTEKVSQHMQNIEVSIEGRYIMADICHDQQIVTIAAIYAPNENNRIFFQELAEKLRTRQEKKIIVGDFNLTLNVELDRKNTYCNNETAKDELENLMDEFLLRDPWRERNGEKREYSWFKKQERGEDRKASRIDYALVSGGLDQKIPCIMYLSSVMTDHRAVYLVLELTPDTRGSGYWKFNTTLLQDLDFVQYMNKVIENNLLSTQDLTPIEVWEALKKKIKSTSQEFARTRSRDQKLVLAQLSEKVNEYEENLPLPHADDIIYEQTKKELEEVLSQRISGVMFRSKAKWYEQGEKNTKYFYSLEKAKYNYKTCTTMIGEEQQLITDPKSILEHQCQFYEQLYKADVDVKFTLSNNFGIYVPNDIKEKQDQQLLVQDLCKAMKLMNNNKTPGSDGIPVDFYKVFWSRLSTAFYNMIEEVFATKYLHDTAREGILNLIPKQQKDTRLVKNLRPITLLNSDYKIIEKAIAEKMLPALEHIIHKDQRGFMKDRRISVNIRKMLDIIHEAEKEDMEAIILSLDFVKCFDKCSFEILHGSLEFFQFGEIVKEWTKILYKDFRVKVQNNGNFSRYIAVDKGVHQGGCCSSVYFLVIAEILALSLRANQDIDGITIRDVRHLLNQFADDMDIASLCNEKSLKAISKELDDFRLQSGFTVSYDKTTMYRIGSLRYSSACMYNMSQFVWSNEDINVLGITIAQENIVDKNYQVLIGKTKATLKAWYNRGLSLIGKIQVVNTLVASLYVYKMMVLPSIPRKLLQCIDNIIRDFLWDGKKAKIAYHILQNPKKEGGLNLVNLRHKEIALKATWPKILVREEEYASLVYKHMRCSVFGENIWRCRLLKYDIERLKIRNIFWKDVLVCWNEYNYSKNFRIENQIIWYNSQIRIANTPVFWRHAYSAGLIYVYQLFHNRNWKDYDTLHSQYGLNYVQYNSIKCAVPKEWRHFFTTYQVSTFLPLPPHNFDSIKCTENTTGDIYKYLNGDVFCLNTKFKKWNQDLGEELCEDVVEFGRLHVNVYKVTNVAKYRSFQYRLLQRAIVTNVQLCSWHILSSSLCSFCHQDEETVIHLLYNCPIVQELWGNIISFIKQEYKATNVTFILSYKRVVLNNIVDGNHIANFVCLLAKYYIYSQRCLKRELHISSLKSFVKKTEQIEKYIAIKNGKLGFHHKKWNHSITSQDSRTVNENYINQYVNNMDV